MLVWPYCIPVTFALTATPPTTTASLSGFALSQEVPEGWCLGRPLAIFCIRDIRAILILEGWVGLSKTLENNSAFEICGGERWPWAHSNRWPPVILMDCPSMHHSSGWEEGNGWAKHANVPLIWQHRDETWLERCEVYTGFVKHSKPRH